MRPDAEAPVFATDEIGVVIGDSQIVNGGPSVGEVHGLDGNRFVLMRQQLHPCTKFPGRQPALPHNPKRVFGGRADHLTVDRDFEQFRQALKHFLDLFFLDDSVLFEL